MDFAYEHHLILVPVISAAGTFGPKLVDLKRNKMPYLVVVRDGACITDTPSDYLLRHSVVKFRNERGSVDASNFMKWADVFIDYEKDLTKNDRKVVLIYDAYRVHTSIQMTRRFHHKVIVVYAFPPHSSGKILPLNVTVFGSFKQAISRAASDCGFPDDPVSIHIFHFCRLLTFLFQRSFLQKVIHAGFRLSDLMPLGASKIINVPRPATNAPRDILMLISEELRVAVERKTRQLRENILGVDTEVARFGFIDTNYGCVMTKAHALRPAEAKAKSNRAKWFRAEAVRASKAVEDAKLYSARQVEFTDVLRA